MRRHRRRSVSNEEIGLQIAPMIDVTMLLLFFFMLSTTLKDKNPLPQIDVPSIKYSGESAPRKNTIIVVISKAGETLINGKITRDIELSLEIARQAKTTETSKVVAEIYADARTDGATIKKVVSAFHAGGVSEVSYAIRNN